MAHIKILLAVVIVCFGGGMALAEDSPPKKDLSWFAVEITVGPGWDYSIAPNEQAYFKEHSAHLSALRKAGHIAMGARYSDVGLLMIQAASADDVRALMNADPSMQAGTLQFDIHPMNVFYPARPATPPPPAGACELTPRQVVENFADLLYKQKKVREAFETWVHPDYIQHKPTLPDGREPVISFLEKLIERFPERTFTIHRIVASDDLVFVHYHSQATPDDPGFAVVDMFRVEDCLMVEHWDVVQPVPEESANDNTMF